MQTEHSKVIEKRIQHDFNEELEEQAARSDGEYKFEFYCLTTDLL